MPPIASSSESVRRLARARLLGLLCAALAAAALNGCGGGSDAGGAQVGLTVTRDFGARTLTELSRAKVAGSDSVMRVLDRNAAVVSRSGGRSVQDINGVPGDRRGGRPGGWFFYVNGVAGETTASSVAVHGGDRIWWDHHDASVTTASVPAVVGSFPEPFLHGRDGRRLPVRVECADPASTPCDAVAEQLIERGVPAGRSSLSHSPADETLRVLVGPWKRLRRRDAEADKIDAGPRASGVFARFDATASKLVVLDERGRRARTLGAGSGLVAATRAEQRQPVWYVTGTDDAGVGAAARAFDKSVLSDAFALAIADDLPVRVPLTRSTEPGREP